MNKLTDFVLHQSSIIDIWRHFVVVANLFCVTVNILLNRVRTEKIVSRLITHTDKSEAYSKFTK